ncbi:hypothetical protein HZB94_02385 [Candidatus Falkowbacteria bacterium]|nr:hypothetical protein [Candidatus Falkowbacteria bacterium]
MKLFILLGIPLVIGLIGFFATKISGSKKITWKELGLHSITMIVIIGVGYFIAYKSRITDTEIWNGRIAGKTTNTTGCCHSYNCFCHQSCSGSGASQSCIEVCSTCYVHSNDVEWTATTTNGEVVFRDGCNSPHSSPPARWSQIKIGEPTAVEHSYTNYILGNPDAVLKQKGALAKFKGKIPDYPRVYDYYRVKRFISIGVSVPDIAGLNEQLDEINALLGKSKQVNIIVIVVNETNASYLDALTEAWVGGKKNDFVVVIAAPAFPKIAWAGVMSWAKDEALKQALAGYMKELGDFNGKEILQAISTSVDKKFVRRHMADFEYLTSTIEPSNAAFWILFMIAVLLSIVLQTVFYIHDPFGDDETRRPRQNYY